MKQIPVLTFSRVVGYFSPVQGWNKGKQAEFEDRLTYDINKLKEGETK